MNTHLCLIGTICLRLLVTQCYTIYKTAMSWSWVLLKQKFQCVQYLLPLSWFKYDLPCSINKVVFCQNPGQVVLSSDWMNLPGQGYGVRITSFAVNITAKHGVFCFRSIGNARTTKPKESIGIVALQD